MNGRNQKRVGGRGTVKEKAPFSNETKPAFFVFSIKNGTLAPTPSKRGGVVCAQVEIVLSALDYYDKCWLTPTIIHQCRGVRTRSSSPPHVRR